MNFTWLDKRIKSNTLKSIALLCFIFIISSCGFHLRGHQSLENSAELKGTQVYLAVTSEDMQFQRQIKIDLQFLGFKVIDDALAPAVHLVVTQSVVDKRAIGIDSIGRNNEFEIIHQINYLVNFEQLKALDTSRSSAMENSQDELVVHQLSSRRSFYLDNEDLIGKRAEEATLLDAMRQELSRKLVNHLVISLNQHKDSSTH